MEESMTDYGQQQARCGICGSTLWGDHAEGCTWYAQQLRNTQNCAQQTVTYSGQQNAYQTALPQRTTMDEPITPAKPEGLLCRFWRWLGRRITLRRH